MGRETAATGSFFFFHVYLELIYGLAFYRDLEGKRKVKVIDAFALGTAGK